jgi:hypothetical protein
MSKRYVRPVGTIKLFRGVDFWRQLTKKSNLVWYWRRAMVLDVESDCLEAMTVSADTHTPLGT